MDDNKWQDDSDDRELYERWTSHLRGDEDYVYSFYGDCNGYHEHAARFFLKHCLVDERSKILSRPNFNGLAKAATSGCVQ